MGLSVVTNVGALVSGFAAARHSSASETSMQRLSSGYRINSAADDVAGASISARLSADIGGLTQAMRNAADAQNFLDTAEGAYGEVSNILLRIRELAVQASSSTNSTSDIGYIEDEMTALESEITAIGTDTTWSDIEMIGGDAAAFQFQLGSNSGDDITVTTTALTLSALSLSASSVTDTTTASSYIATVDSAIETLNGLRSDVAEVSNRLNFTIANLTNNLSNITKGKSNIKDADFAKETTALTKNQILQQSATAMLAQANASKADVLILLRT